jgi:hypothetical protein
LLDHNKHYTVSSTTLKAERYVKNKCNV